MTNKLFAAATFTLVLATAPAAFAAEALTLSVQATPASSTRVQRRFSLTAVSSTFFPVNMLGIQANYHLTDRLALNAQLRLGLPVADAGVGARFFLNAEPRSGLFVDASAHALASIGMHAWGPAAELGYQYRGTSGFLFEASGSLMVLNVSSGCGCRPPGSPESSWEAFPVVNLRFGYAF